MAALFEHVEVLGPNEVWLYPSVEAEAGGWASAMAGDFKVEVRMVGARGFPPSCLTQALSCDLCASDTVDPWRNQLDVWLDGANRDSTPHERSDDEPCRPDESR